MPNMEGNFVGEIRSYGGVTEPAGWLFCDGRLVSITQYETLFSLIGAKFGGNGTTQFALPDLWGRVPVGLGVSQQSGHNYSLGEAGGNDKKPLTKAHMPRHHHTCSLTVDESRLMASTIAGDNSTPIADGVLSKVRDYSDPINDDPKQYVGPGAGNLVALGSIKVTSAGGAQTGSAGGGNTHEYNNHMPFVAANMIIAFEGVYPERS